MAFRRPIAATTVVESNLGSSSTATTWPEPSIATSEWPASSCFPGNRKQRPTQHLRHLFTHQIKGLTVCGLIGNPAQLSRNYALPVGFQNRHVCLISRFLTALIISHS